MKKGFLWLLISLSVYGQASKDTLFDNVKSIREKVEFKDKDVQNKKLFSDEGDYGHYGFTSPEFEVSRFKRWWYETKFVHYVNYFKEFDSVGKAVNEAWFYKENDTAMHYHYKHDKRGKLIKKKSIYFDGSFRMELFYYEDKLLSSLKYDSEDNDFYRYELYDYANDKLKKHSVFNEEGEEGSFLYEYNDNGKLIKTFYHTPYKWIKKESNSNVLTHMRGEDGVKFLKNEIIYKNDKVIRRNYYQLDDEEDNLSYLNRVVLIDYNNQGKVVKRSFSKDGVDITNYYEYNYYNNGLLKEESHIVIGFPESSRSSTYVYSNELLKKLIHKENGKKDIITFTYEFDEHANWITQTKSINGIELFIWSRIIEYF